MQSALNSFEANLRKVAELEALHRSLQGLVTNALDLSDLLRAQVVLAVSALDYFVHEVVRVGMLEVEVGGRPATVQNESFPVSLASVRRAQANPGENGWLDDAVRSAHSWRSFQDPERIAEAIRLVSPESLWERVGTEMGRPAKDVKTELKVLVDRRNKIAHEGDVDPTNPGERWPISDLQAASAVKFVNELAHAIFKVIK